VISECDHISQGIKAHAGHKPLPRMADQPEDRRSMHIFRYLGVAEEERVSEARMNELAAQIRQILLFL
jgi:hypothetical protein